VYSTFGQGYNRDSGYTEEIEAENARMSAER